MPTFATIDIDKTSRIRNSDIEKDVGILFVLSLPKLRNN